jgi:DNA-binding XRE family transcriptional regulator
MITIFTINSKFGYYSDHKLPLSKKSAVVFPKNRLVLEQLSENIKLAYKRREHTQAQISERTGLSRLTIRKIEQGEPSASTGQYIAVLGVLGRKLQDIKLLNK